MHTRVYECSVCEARFESGKKEGEHICDPCIGVLRDYGLGPVQLQHPTERVMRLQPQALQHGASIVTDKIMAAHVQRPEKVMSARTAQETVPTVLKNVQRILDSL